MAEYGHSSQEKSDEAHSGGLAEDSQQDGNRIAALMEPIETYLERRTTMSAMFRIRPIAGNSTNISPKELAMPSRP